MVGKGKDYFVCANTAAGFVDFFADNLEDLEYVFILKGGSGSGKSTMMKKLGRLCQQWGLAVDYIHCSSDPKSLDGIIVPDLRVAVTDGTAPHVLEPLLAGVTGEIINLGLALNREMLRKDKKDMLKLKKDIKNCYQKVYQGLAEAKAVHDQWENLYSPLLNKTKADALRQNILAEIFGDKRLMKKPSVRHRFFGALAADGRVDYLQDLIAPLAKRYILTGRPGCGKSTLLKQIAQESEERGYHTEIYHCSLDPDSLDMVLIEELSLAVLDGTAPHTIAPMADDVVLDLYQMLIDDAVDQTQAEAIAQYSAQYDAAVAKAHIELKAARKGHQLLERFYQPAVDFAVIEEFTAVLAAELQTLAAKQS